MKVELYCLLFGGVFAKENIVNEADRLKEARASVKETEVMYIFMSV